MKGKENVTKSGSVLFVHWDWQGGGQNHEGYRKGLKKGKGWHQGDIGLHKDLCHKLMDFWYVMPSATLFCIFLGGPIGELCPDVELHSRFISMPECGSKSQRYSPSLPAWPTRLVWFWRLSPPFGWFYIYPSRGRGPQLATSSIQ